MKKYITLFVLLIATMLSANAQKIIKDGEYAATYSVIEPGVDIQSFHNLKVCVSWPVLTMQSDENTIERMSIAPGNKPNKVKMLDMEWTVVFMPKDFTYILSAEKHGVCYIFVITSTE